MLLIVMLVRFILLLPMNGQSGNSGDYFGNGDSSGADKEIPGRVLLLLMMIADCDGSDDVDCW